MAVTRHVLQQHLQAVALRFVMVVFLCGLGCQSDVETPKAPAPAKPFTPQASIQTNIRFVDRTAESGMAFIYHNGQEHGHFAILESLGGGAALIDYDCDGRVDVFLPGGGEFGPQNEPHGLIPGLFRQVDAWLFENAARESSVDRAPFYSHGVAACDFNNDGFVDLVVTGYGGLLLFVNNGDGTFDEIADRCGLKDSSWSSSAGWGDLNNDGFPDLYVAHYLNWSFENHPYCPSHLPNRREVCPPRDFDPLPDVVFLNNADGTFDDATQEIGLRRDGKGLGVLLADFDVDNDIDVYVANDTVGNFLYENDGRGHLRDVSLSSGTAMNESGLPDGSMGVETADYNLDGLPDLWTANYERESFALYRNHGNLFFQHVSQVTGVTASGGNAVGWGTVFADFDQDQDEDVFASNGHVNRYPINAPLRQKPLLFENRAGQSFINVASQAGAYMNGDHEGRGVATGDIDNDGDVDMVISRLNEPAVLLANESTDGNHWLAVRLIGRVGNRNALGARIEIRRGGVILTRQIKGGSSYASTNDSRVFFGLKQAEAVDELNVNWPSGAVTSVRDVPADQFLNLLEPRHRADR